jgi:hypothetical protein
MTHFSLQPGMVRGELFKPPTDGGGKWKYTVQIDMSKHYNDLNIYDAVLASYRETPASVRGVIDGCTGYLLVVFDPYHKNAYPVAVMI